MVQMNSVRGAYTRLGRKRGLGSSRYLFFGAIVVFLFVIMNSGHKKDSLSNPGLRPVETEEVSQSEDEDHEMVSMTEMHAVVETAKDDIENLEASELEKDETLLSSAMKSAGDYVRVGMTQFLGDSVSTEEVEEMAHAVEERLEFETNEELHSAADNITAHQVSAIDRVYVEDEKFGVSGREIETDVLAREEKAFAEVKDGLNKATSDITMSIHSRAQEIEKEILEERLSLKLGKKVKLVFIEDEIRSEDMDDLFVGLKTLGGGTGSSSEQALLPGSTYGTHAEPTYKDSESQFSTTSSYSSQAESQTSDHTNTWDEADSAGDDYDVAGDDYSESNDETGADDEWNSEEGNEEGDHAADLDEAGEDDDEFGEDGDEAYDDTGEDYNDAPEDGEDADNEGPGW